jgi:hypothetical protein
MKLSGEQVKQVKQVQNYFGSAKPNCVALATCTGKFQATLALDSKVRIWSSLRGVLVARL